MFSVISIGIYEGRKKKVEPQPQPELEPSTLDLEICTYIHAGDQVDLTQSKYKEIPCLQCQS
jgi:hypothetical protein